MLDNETHGGVELVLAVARARRERELLIERLSGRTRTSARARPWICVVGSTPVFPRVRSLSSASIKRRSWGTENLVGIVVSGELVGRGREGG